MQLSGSDALTAGLAELHGLMAPVSGLRRNGCCRCAHNLTVVSHVCLLVLCCILVVCCGWTLPILFPKQPALNMHNGQKCRRIEMLTSVSAVPCLVVHCSCVLARLTDNQSCDLKKLFSAVSSPTYACSTHNALGLTMPCNHASHIVAAAANQR